MVKPNDLTATQAVVLMKEGRLSVEDMAQACLTRIRARDPVVRGWVHLDPDLILRNARALDQTAVKGPLHGVPIAVKDVIMTSDMPTEHNSPLYKGSFPVLDAGCVKTLRAAGALIFGKTDTTEFAAVTRGGTARHPLDAGRTPGGSSSGSAAVVGDNQVPIGLGTQTAGSTIRPASFCGIYAMKPTWGAITREGLKMLSLSLDTLGLFARSAEDLDLLADVFALEDRSSFTPFTLRGARIAACRSPAWDQTEPATRGGVRARYQSTEGSRRRHRAPGPAARLLVARRAPHDRDVRRGTGELPERAPSPTGPSSRGSHGHGPECQRNQQGSACGSL